MAYTQGGLNIGIEPISAGNQAAEVTAVPKVLPRNYDSNPARVNQFQNQKQFLTLTTQDRHQFSSKSIDIAFNDGAGTVGMNPFFQAPSTASKVFTA